MRLFRRAMPAFHNSALRRTNAVIARMGEAHRAATMPSLSSVQAGGSAAIASTGAGSVPLASGASCCACIAHSRA